MIECINAYRKSDIKRTLSDIINTARAQLIFNDNYSNEDEKILKGIVKDVLDKTKDQYP